MGRFVLNGFWEARGTPLERGSERFGGKGMRHSPFAGRRAGWGMLSRLLFFYRGSRLALLAELIEVRLLAARDPIAVTPRVHEGILLRALTELLRFLQSVI